MDKEILKEFIKNNINKNVTICNKYENYIDGYFKDCSYNNGFKLYNKEIFGDNPYYIDYNDVEAINVYINNFDIYSMKIKIYSINILKTVFSNIDKNNALYSLYDKNNNVFAAGVFKEYNDNYVIIKDLNLNQKTTNYSYINPEKIKYVYFQKLALDPGKKELPINNQSNKEIEYYNQMIENEYNMQRKLEDDYNKLRDELISIKSPFLHSVISYNLKCNLDAQKLAEAYIDHYNAGIKHYKNEIPQYDLSGSYNKTTEMEKQNSESAISYFNKYLKDYKSVLMPMHGSPHYAIYKTKTETDPVINEAMLNKRKYLKNRDNDAK